jgi:hypothetical protein
MQVPANFGPLQFYWSSIAAEVLALPRDIAAIDRDGKSHAQVAAEIIAAGIPCWTESWGEQRHNWLTWGLAIDGTFPLGAQQGRFYPPDRRRTRAPAGDGCQYRSIAA